MKLRLLMITHGALEYDFGLEHGALEYDFGLDFYKYIQYIYKKNKYSLIHKLLSNIIFYNFNKFNHVIMSFTINMFFIIYLTKNKYHNNIFVLIVLLLKNAQKSNASYYSNNLMRYNHIVRILLFF